MMSHPLIAPPAVPVALREVRKVYRRGGTAVRVLGGVSAEFARRSFTAVMGPSGSGKGTLLHCAAGLERPTSGSVWLAGQDLGRSEKRLTRLRRSSIGFVFQAFNRQLLRMVRIEQAVMLGLALLVGGAIGTLTLVPMVKGTTGSATPYIPQADGSP